MDQMLWYTIVLLALTILPVAFGAFGWLYLASAVLLGALLLRGVLQIRTLDARGESWTVAAWWTYKYSLLYLALLFVAMVVDRVIA
jgi:protoheme IX farnesyltransferase